MNRIPSNFGKTRGLLRLAVLVCVCCCWLLLNNPRIARAEDHKKAEHSEPKSKSGKKKEKKEKVVLEKVSPDAAVGADTKISDAQFEADAEQAGKVDAVIVLDASRSMQRTDPNRLRDQSAKLFLRFLGTGDRAAILSFDKEVKTIVPLGDVTPASLPNLDKAIEGLENEGGFTDLEAAIEQAMQILVAQGRSDAAKTVILLSDGQMDPHPSKGTPAEAIQRVKVTDLPQYHDKNIHLYTLAFSTESDKKLLAEFAQLGGGQSWYAVDATTIHKKFSELFLTLKRPQVVPLEGAGFEIDSSVQEATFYITRKETDGPITVVDPRGTEISVDHIPPGVKWFSGELFEVVTLTKPFPGRWSVKGVETAEGFATLLSDIKLQVRWPQAMFKPGDSVAVYARLTNGGEELAKSGLEEITFYTYKIVNSENGSTYLTGAMNDKGDNGDVKLLDSIYSTTIKLDKEGEYQAFFAVTSPTFTRQQRVSFSVTGALIELRVIPPDDFAGTPESLQAVMTKEPNSLKNLKVQLVAKKSGTANPVGLTLKPRKETPTIYDIPIDKLKPGDYELYVRLTATDEKKKAVNAATQTMNYTIQPREGASEDSAEIEELGEEAAPHNYGGIIVGILCVLLAGGWVFGLSVMGLKKVSSGKGTQIAERKAYTVPPELAQRVQAITGSAAQARRKASDSDKQIFSLVADVFSGEVENETIQQEAPPPAAPEAEQH